VDATVNAAIREFCYGTWSISSTALLFVLTYYLYCMKAPGFWRKVEVQAAAALGMLVFGHVVLSFFSWGEWTFMVSRPDVGILTRAEPFIFGTAFILAGKFYCTWMFTYGTRLLKYTVLWADGLATFIIPAIVLYTL
jgi:hypothetical protein